MSREHVVRLGFVAVCNLVLCLSLIGYGFVDFDSPAAAQKAVSALKTTGVQAQMAKVRVRLHGHTSSYGLNAHCEFHIAVM